MSINRAQAEALADGFLNSVGSGSKDDLKPRETFTEVILIAGELVEDAQKNLNRSGSIASGKLSASIEASKPILHGNVLSVDIYMNYYGLFVNKGVKGKKSGSSKAGYKFTKPGPSKSFVESIQKWIKRSGIQVRNVKKAVSKLEIKRKAISELNKGRSVAYATAMSIMNKGIKGNGFFDRAAKKAVNKVGSRLGVALEIDVITSLK